MTIEELTKAMNATPFQAFTLFLSDGRSFRVMHPEFIMRSGTGRMVVVSEPEMKTVEVIDLLHVTGMQYSNESSDQSQAS
ncbi:MAG: hypothetical protein AAGB26_03055 [Planctomycetota bacterium]